MGAPHAAAYRSTVDMQVLAFISNYYLHASTVHRWLIAAGLVWARIFSAKTMKKGGNTPSLERMQRNASGILRGRGGYPFQSQSQNLCRLQIWSQLKRVVKLGHDEKYYLVGAAHCGTCRVSYVGRNRKSSVLLKNIGPFVKTVSPFPGGNHGLAIV